MLSAEETSKGDSGGALLAARDFAPPSGGGRPDLLVIAGEHSGDEHAAHLVAGIKARYPEHQICCLGGVHLQAAGAQLLYDLTAVSIIGFVEVLRHYGFFKDLFARTLDWIERYQPREICFVDYPGFNLRLAEALHQRELTQKSGGSIRLSYYIGPQIWAWKAKRRFKMARLLDRLGVIFPFEVDCYRDTDLPVAFVGHPFVQADYILPFVYSAAAPVLLLPGSRTTPVARIFPLLLESFALALKSAPELTAIVVYPSQQIREQLALILSRYPAIQDKIQFQANGQPGLAASAVLMSSGTMSLAVALSGIPGAIAYRLNPVSYWMGRYLVKVPYIGIANLLLRRAVHPEFIQGAASPRKLAAALLAFRSAPQASLAATAAAELRAQLSPPGEADAVAWLLED